MKWMKERDLLIAQTMAFVQSVTGKLPESDRTATMAAEKTPAAPPEDTSESLRTASLPVAVTSPAVDRAPLPVGPALPLPALEELSPPEKALPILAQQEAATVPAVAALPRSDVPRPDLRVDFQSEIKARVASFRAHQERFSREREAYCSTTMAKVHASIREVALPTISGK